MDFIPKGNKVFVKHELFLTVHKNKDNPVPLKEQAKLVASILNGKVRIIGYSERCSKHAQTKV